MRTDIKERPKQEKKTWLTIDKSFWQDFHLPVWLNCAVRSPLCNCNQSLKCYFIHSFHCNAIVSLLGRSHKLRNQPHIPRAKQDTVAQEHLPSLFLSVSPIHTSYWPPAMFIDLFARNARTKSYSPCVTMSARNLYAKRGRNGETATPWRWRMGQEH